MPYYSVTTGTDTHLVKAKTTASAIRHVVNGKVSAKLLNNDDLAEMLVAGAKLEDATTEPEPAE
jgi:hypothetical protein